MEYDIPTFTDHETRAMIYIRQVNRERSNSKPAPTIADLSRACDWDSKYFTRAWKRLQPKNLVKRIEDGRHTRLELTGKGEKVADKFLEINEVLNP